MIASWLRRRGTASSASSTYRPGSTTPNSRAPSRRSCSWRPASRSASGALAVPGTAPGTGGRRPRLDGAATIPSSWAMRGDVTQVPVARRGTLSLRAWRLSGARTASHTGTMQTVLGPAEASTTNHDERWRETINRVFGGLDDRLHRPAHDRNRIRMGDAGPLRIIDYDTGSGGVEPLEVDAGVRLLGTRIDGRRGTAGPARRPAATAPRPAGGRARGRRRPDSLRRTRPPARSVGEPARPRVDDGPEKRRRVLLLQCRAIEEPRRPAMSPPRSRRHTTCRCATCTRCSRTPVTRSPG